MGWNASFFPVVRTLLAAGGLVVAVVLALKIAVLVLEPRLAFYPVREYFQTPAAAGMPFEDVFLRTGDGARIHGWFIPGTNKARANAGSRADDSPTGSASHGPPITLLFFHGNAENIGGCLDLAAHTRPAGYNLLLIDYRGYGQSDGQPSESGLYRDGEAALHYLRSWPGVDPSRIVVWGRSVGSAVAVFLAAGDAGTEHGEPVLDAGAPSRGPGSASLAGVILESAFTSAPDLLKTGGHWVLYTAARFGTYRFDSAARMARVTAPLLVIHGTADEIAPFSLGRRLYELAPGRKEFVAIRGGGHNDLLPRHADDLWGAVERFLSSLT